MGTVKLMLVTRSLKQQQEVAIYGLHSRIRAISLSPSTLHLEALLHMSFEKGIHAEFLKSITNVMGSD